MPSQTCTILFKKTYEYIFVTPILFTLILMFIYLSNDGNQTVIPSVFFIGFHPGGGNILCPTTPSNLLGNF